MTRDQLAEMHGKTDAIERVNMRVRIAELEAALRPFVFGDPALEEILFADTPDDATGTVTIKMRDIRRARAALRG